MPKIITQIEFIERSNFIHNNKYDYSKTIFLKIDKNIEVICPIHGNFILLAANHIHQKQGCSTCKKENQLNYGRVSKQEFINRSIILHDYKYDYSNSNYFKTSQKIEIYCKKHNKKFLQTPQGHLSGRSGCKECRYEKTSLSQLSTKEKFISKATLIHSNKFDYSKVNYKGALNKINIICSKHGVFKQLPSSHLQGIGCPICKESKGEKFISEYLNSKKINYIRQHTFKDCKHIYVLRFDFYIPELKTCIEFDGKFHFENLLSPEMLNQTIRNDEIKNKYCNTKDIRLIRISYKENIQNILDEALIQKIQE